MAEQETKKELEKLHHFNIFLNEYRDALEAHKCDLVVISRIIEEFDVIFGGTIKGEGLK